MKKLLFVAIGLVALSACSVRSDHSQKTGRLGDSDKPRGHCFMVGRRGY